MGIESIKGQFNDLFAPDYDKKLTEKRWPFKIGIKALDSHLSYLDIQQQADVLSDEKKCLGYKDISKW